VIDGIKIRGRGSKISTNLSLGERAWGLTHKNAGSKRVLKKVKYLFQPIDNKTWHDII